MALRRILRDDDPALYKVCRPVQNIDQRVCQLIDDMLETMYHAQGVGLAAPQVGILRRIAVIDCGEGPIELINPEIVSADGLQQGYEGCLSFPGQSGYVERPDHVVLRAYNRKGELVEYEGTGLLARAMLHETDHLDGKVFLRLVTEPPEDWEEEEGGEAE